MTTTHDVLVELTEQPVVARCCRRAELAAAVRFAGVVGRTGDLPSIRVDLDRMWLAERLVTMAGRDLPARLEPQPPGTSPSARRRYVVGISCPARRPADFYRLLRSGEGLLRQERGEVALCDARSWWRGAFLVRGRLRWVAAGQVVEVRCPGRGAAEELRALARRLGADGGVELSGASLRFGDPAGARALLAAIGAPGCAADRVPRARSPVSVLPTAFHRERFAATADVEVALRVLGSAAPEELRLVGALRLRHPEEPLSILAGRLVPPVSPSTVARRLRQLVALAQEAVWSRTSAPGAGGSVERRRDGAAGAEAPEDRPGT
ncbi:hypothetical protein AB0A74_01305 [Saccharothrix sp. NPDC042600]|uniref:hypothetical protein n=1 Tax=Saccharothrix TaxID=2071 RepID=UPI00340DCCE2|nr:DNA-binding protein WhiA [Saccharothrix mutabilis subsp. capreolus]